jgi:hypothetical protein
MAAEAWNDYRDAHSDIPYSTDFADGFRDGFADYLYAGGNGEPPLLPPPCYRSIHYQTAQGFQAKEDWFAGFRQGAAIAQAGGYRQWITGPSSLGSSVVANGGCPIEAVDGHAQKCPTTSTELANHKERNSVHDSVAAFAKNAGESSQPAFLANAATSIKPSAEQPPTESRPVPPQPAPIAPASFQEVMPPGWVDHPRSKVEVLVGRLEKIAPVSGEPARGPSLTQTLMQIHERADTSIRPTVTIISH